MQALPAVIVMVVGLCLLVLVARRQPDGWWRLFRALVVVVVFFVPFGWIWLINRYFTERRWKTDWHEVQTELGLPLTRPPSRKRDFIREMDALEDQLEAKQQPGHPAKAASTPPRFGRTGL
jgi:4-amino-4-deoxy-L-arabinose transferase-like glycosyltransferase